MQTTKNRKFPLGNSLLYISLSSVAFGRVRPGGRTLFLFVLISSRIRIAFRTAMIVTPTSPNTASHIPAMPSAPRTRNTLLMPRAITMFCITIRFVAFATSMASTSFDGSSVIRTTSAASIAASEPRPPMAMPTSVRARTGASLMPSPTKASLLPCRFCLSSISSFSTFWSGKSCA